MGHHLVGVEDEAEEEIHEDIEAYEEVEVMDVLPEVSFYGSDTEMSKHQHH